MKNSGYGPKARENVLVEGLKHFYRALHRELNNGRKMSQRNPTEATRKTMLKIRDAEFWFQRRRVGADEIFKKNLIGQPSIGHSELIPRKPRCPVTDLPKLTGEQCTMIATLDIPYTPKSKLCKLIQNMDDKISLELKQPKIRIMEKGGNKLADLLIIADPWAKLSDCGRSKCKVCWGIKYLEDRKEKAKLAGVKIGNEYNLPDIRHCSKEGAIYELDCIECLDQGIMS